MAMLNNQMVTGTAFPSGGDFPNTFSLSGTDLGIPL